MFLRSLLYERTVLSHLERVRQLPQEAQAEIAMRVSNFIELARPVSDDLLSRFVQVAREEQQRAVEEGARSDMDALWAAMRYGLRQRSPRHGATQGWGWPQAISTGTARYRSSLPSRPSRGKESGSVSVAFDLHPSLPDQPAIGSPGRTSRTSPSVMPQLARVAAGMWPTILTTSSAADLATASVALSSPPIATKNHCSIERSSALACLVNKRTTRPSAFCCISALWHAMSYASTCLDFAACIAGTLTKGSWTMGDWLLNLGLQWRSKIRMP